MADHIQHTIETKSVKPECFHCGLAIANNTRFEIELNGNKHPVCCAGCQGVAQAIIDNNLQEFYRYRDSAKSQKPENLVPSGQKHHSIYDRSNVRSRYVKSVSSDVEEITLMLEGLTCAACAWLIEKQLAKQAGISDIEVNFSTLTAKLRWNQNLIPLSRILTIIREIGYVATPYEPRIQYQQLLKQRSQQLKRIGITAALGMQVMIISVALYFGHYSGIDENWKGFFYKLGLLFTLPIILYSALPFFKASSKQILRLQPGMDVPVCLGLTLAFTASVWATISAQGEVYYDSVAMFVFLLLVARYFMHDSILAASHSIERLAANTPLIASRLLEHSVSSLSETVTAEELNPGDWIRVLAGHVIPADGFVVNGSSTVNKAVISGESKPIEVSPNEQVIAGSINNESPLIIKVTACGEKTVYAAIEKMARQGLAQSSSDLPVIDLIARWFVISVLTIAAVVALYWWHHSPGQWLAITVAVLVVSCPCALSLSVPSAYAATTSKLIENGLMLTDTAALERLTKVSHVIFDKTGTLTRQDLHVEAIEIFTDVDEQNCLTIAASLGVNSDHPLARAIMQKNKQPLLKIDNWHDYPGLGVSATLDGQRYFLGSAKFIQQQTDITPSAGKADSVVYLASNKSILTRFNFGYCIREGVTDVLDYFNSLDKPVLMLTGDTAVAAKQLAQQLDIKIVHSECSPEDKLNIVKSLQNNKNATVLTIGDGINDSPVLAASDVSVAVAGASPLAVSGADIVMANPSLKAVTKMHQYAGKTATIIRQNISWAVGYNLLAIPFAASGFITPLFAAIGMSLSSIIVVLNAQRLRSDRIIA